MTVLRRCVATVVAASLLSSSLAMAAPAGLIGAEQALASPTASQGASDAHLRLAGLLERDDLASALRARGVAPGAVQARVDALTDDEAREMLAQIDQLPAGGNILGVIVTLFLVLLVTDILGLTKVFPFTRSINR